MESYDFGGWATRANLRCTDGLTIMPDAFKHNDGKKCPLVWNHNYDSIENVLGTAILEHREGEGMYAYCSFNDTEIGQKAKKIVQHGDIGSLSIHANRIKKQHGNVSHGDIKEVSLVLSGANPGAFIDYVVEHADGDYDEANIYWSFDDDTIELYHADGEEPSPKGDDEVAEKTIAEIIDTMNEEQKNAMYAVLGQAFIEEGEEGGTEATHGENYEGENYSMHHNVFDQNESGPNKNVLTHSDQEEIIRLAKQSNVGSLKNAISLYLEDNDMIQHSEDGFGVFEDYGVLFPELELITKGEPETIYKYDQSWISPALSKIHKSPFSRIRTRHADARVADLKAKGYQKKGNEKKIMGQIKMITRETTPQTIYIKDNLHRDDIIDITDFDIVGYQWKQMRRSLEETMVLAAMVGDGRQIDDPDKISEEHIRPIWKDNEEYTIHHDIDIEAAKSELQGTDTGKHFGENYIYAEAVITASLYSREKFKGTGTPDFYCTPHLVNVMLLARDLNGRRIYDSKDDLAKALNCKSIVEVEQFEGLTRTTEDGKTKKLLGLFVNLNDYTFGSTKGGQITTFEDFDMDFNLKKFLMETRLSGSLYKLKSAVALEEETPAVSG